EKAPHSPFVSPMVERDVYVDSSETGWGASLLGVEVCGVFPTSVIGQRELAGFLASLSHHEITEIIEGKVGRVNIDSKCAIANLLHAGPVKTLTHLVQVVWRRFEELRIHPVFQWVPRETDGLRRVDELSKRISFKLSDKFHEAYETVLGRTVVVVNH